MSIHYDKQIFRTKKDSNRFTQQMEGSTVWMVHTTVFWETVDCSQERTEELSDMNERRRQHNSSWSVPVVTSWHGERHRHFDDHHWNNEWKSSNTCGTEKKPPPSPPSPCWISSWRHLHFRFYLWTWWSTSRIWIKDDEQLFSWSHL